MQIIKCLCGSHDWTITKPFANYDSSFKDMIEKKCNYCGKIKTIFPEEQQ